MSTTEEKWDIIRSDSFSFLRKYKASDEIIKETMQNIATAQAQNEIDWCICPDFDSSDVEPMISSGTGFVICNKCGKKNLD